MTPATLRSLTAAPNEQSLVVQALWHDAHGNWEAAHYCAQDDHTDIGFWMHAYLHRKEGDIGNARYWYSNAGRSLFNGTLAEEWQALAESAIPSRSGPSGTT